MTFIPPVWVIRALLIGGVLLALLNGAMFLVGMSKGRYDLALMNAASMMLNAYVIYVSEELRKTRKEILNARS